MQRFARWHVWLGWLVGFPMLMWAVTGLFMVARPIEEVRGTHLRAQQPAVDPAGLAFPTTIGEPILEARLVPQPRGPAWLVTSAEGARWRSDMRDLLKGLGDAIDAQFDRWQLTKAEREVALLMLKGLSHKEIAAVRESSERTIRQQARAIYAKANLSGRAALSAFFLEDLLLPIER